MKKDLDDKHIHSGHRARMRNKLLSYGHRIFDSYELLEMLLYHSVAVADTNPLAKRLLHAFGNLDGVFSASCDELMQVKGVGEGVCELIRDAARLSTVLGSEILDGSSPSLLTYDDVGEYLVEYFRDMQDPAVVAMFFDNSMNLIKTKKLYDLEYESGGVRVKPFLDEAVNSNAVVVITAHNHPRGPFFPTPGDRATNTVVTEGLTGSGFVHAEHYIVSGEFYAGIGSIKEFSSKLKTFSETNRILSSIEFEGGDVEARKSTCRFRDIKSFDKAYNRRDLDYFAKLLSYAIGENAREVATSLLEKYTTIENCFTVPVAEITETYGEKCAFCLKIFCYVNSRRKTDLFKIGEKYTECQIVEHLKALFIGESVEKIYLICFDKSDRLCGCHLIAEGTVCTSDIIPRKVVEAAISSSAKSVIMAHNHPFGRPTPSRDDRSLTNGFVDLLGNCEIKFIEHYVIAGQRWCKVLG